MYEQDLGTPMDWDDTEVLDDGGNFVLLEEGTYPFAVASFTRARFEGSAKMAACPKAEVELLVDAGPQGLVTISDGLLLNSKTQWRVAQFFESLGAPKNPETNKVQINWNAIIGKSGMAEIGPRSYTNSRGEERQTNDVKRYLRPAAAVGTDSNAGATMPASYNPAAQAAPQQQWGSQGGF